MISCLYKGLSDPVMLIFDAPVTSRLTDNYNKESKKRLGEAQENLALLSICDATHKTFRGTGIIEFLKGIIWNLNSNYPPYVEIEIKITDIRILKSLDNIMVPFMLPENVKTPDSFKLICNNSKIHFGTYLMTKNRQQIDGVFDLVPVDGNLKKIQCLVEAKNGKDELQNLNYSKSSKRGCYYQSSLIILALNSQCT